MSQVYYFSEVLTRVWSTPIYPGLLPLLPAIMRIESVGALPRKKTEWRDFSLYAVQSFDIT